MKYMKALYCDECRGKGKVLVFEREVDCPSCSGTGVAAAVSMRQGRRDWYKDGREAELGEK